MFTEEVIRELAVRDIFDFFVIDDDWTLIDDDFIVYDDDFLLYNENEGLTQKEIEASLLEDALYQSIQQAFYDLFGENWQSQIEYIDYFFSLIY